LEVANDQKLLTSAIHFGGNWPNNVYKMNQIKAPSGASLHDEFHTYALEWTPSEFRWFLDGQLYHTQRHWWSAHTSETNEITVNPYPKPFDKPFHLILNVAVGGPGTEYTGFKEEDGNRIRDVPQELEVDWVKVYDLTGIPEKTAVKCGDFNCDAGENWMTCPSDCGTYNLPDPVCGDDVCTQGEFVNECPADCTNINPSPPPSSTPPPVPVPGAQPKLLFEDNFDGTVLDSNKWGYQLGNGQEYGIPGWGNGELQSYTDTNAEVAGGNLKIKVLQTDVHAYSSSKIRTLGKFAFKYGRVVAKMKMPLGAQGMYKVV
jgi:beta-glucanase (GH16 family)